MCRLEVELVSLFFLLVSQVLVKTTIMRLLTKEMSPTQGVVSFLRKPAQLKKGNSIFAQRDF